MQEKPTQKLFRRQRHDFGAIAVGVIPVAKSHRAVVEQAFDQARLTFAAGTADLAHAETFARFVAEQWPSA